MALIKEDLVRQLCEFSQQNSDLQAHFQKMSTKYRNQFTYYPKSDVLERVSKINAKKLNKNTTSDPESLQLTQQKTQNFAFGELKLFAWVLGIYCYKHQLDLTELKSNHFESIRTFFPIKSITFLKYQTLCLAHEKSKYCPQWTQEQIKILTQIVNQKQEKCQWRQISFRLFQQSKEEFFRPFQQCRQKWFNHLDPKVRKGKWSIEEDIALLSAIDFLDCKWNEIYRQLGGVRTEHMIKNRYKSLMKKWKKKYEKTSPKKIVSYVLKYLKNKHKKGDINSSMSSNQHEEVPVPTTKKEHKKEQKTSAVQKDKKKKVLNKAAKIQEKSDTKDEQKKLNEIKVIEQKPEQMKQDAMKVNLQEELKQFEQFSVESLEEKENQGQQEFDLGFSVNKWETIKVSSESSENKALNQMMLRQESFQEIKFKQERRTADDEDELLHHLGQSNFSSHLPELSSGKEMLSVSDFGDFPPLYEPESHWLQRLEEQWDRKQDFDFIFGDD